VFALDQLSRLSGRAVNRGIYPNVHAMIVLLLLVVISIMLFGATAVLGVLGFLLAAAVSCVLAMYVLGSLTQVGANAWEALGYGLVSIVGIVFALGATILLTAQIVSARQRSAREAADEERMRLKREEFARTFHARSPSKSERKRMRGGTGKGK
jgi:hypothetical protein